MVTAFAKDGDNNSATVEEERDEDWDTDGKVLKISTAEEMAQFCYLTNLPDTDPDYVDFSGKTVKLTDDIDLSAYNEWPGIYLAEDVTFDGNEHTVTVNIQDFSNGRRPDIVLCGIFSQTDPGSLLKNLKADGEITKDDVLTWVSVGIAGAVYGNVENCTSSIYFTFTGLNTSTYLGGITGILLGNGEISNCLFNGEINVETGQGGSYIGGMAATAQSEEVSINCCENRGTIAINNMNFSNAGGIVGLSASIDQINITNCLFDGEIICTGTNNSPINFIAGILARNCLYSAPSSANISNCLSSGTITLTDDDKVSAGAVFGGSGSSTGDIMTTIKNSYFTSMGDDIGIAYDESDPHLTIDSKSGETDKINQRLVNVLNKGQDEEYWWIGEDGITCLGRPVEDDEDKDDKPGHSYSLEERAPDKDDEKEPEIPEDNDKPDEAEITDIIGHWAEPYIRQVVSDKYMSTITDTLFFPDSPATRLMVADAFYALSGDSYSGISAPFTDISTESVSWLYANKITSGFEDNTFRPNDTVTREQLAVMIYNYMASKGKDVSSIEGMAIYEFSDYSDISEWSKTAIRYCLNSGILSGNTDGTFNPKGNVTRAELAVILNNISNM